MATQGRQAHCFINGEKAFSFTRGIRILSDVKGSIIQVAGMDVRPQQAIIVHRGKTVSLTVEPNAVYDRQKNFSRTRRVEFTMPALP